MARPRIMDDSRILSVVVDKRDVDTIEKARGKTSVSSYIRRLVREQIGPGETDEMLVLQKKLIETKVKLEVFERKEKAVTKEKAEAMAYILKGLELYKIEDNRRADDPETCRRWIEARCKGCGISTSEFLSFHQTRE
jgi:hypothetical protein